jgi:hypothetical protein
LAFESITGLSIYFLSFSIFNQISVLAHSIVGILMVAPVGWYLADHWRRRFRGNFNHYQLLGYVTAATTLILFVSGAVLAWQATFGRRISYGWDLVHIIVGFVFLGALAAHLGTLLIRRINNEAVRRKTRFAQFSCFGRVVGWAGGLALGCWVFASAYDPVDLDRSFPAGYSFKYGDDRPFAPSLARIDMDGVFAQMKRSIVGVLDGGQQKTFLANCKEEPTAHIGIVTVAERLTREMATTDIQRSNISAALQEAKDRLRTLGRVPARELAGSTGCGTSGCHSEILEEWQPSAHRYSSMDFVFQAVQTLMADELAPEATRYCAGCHDPIALFSGAKNVGNVTLSVEGADEGVSCVVCHSVVRTDVRGNADYTISPPERYMFELHDSQWAKGISDFLIRAYPRQHVASYARPLYKTAEACGACHKQFIDEELNDVGWVQGQNQYDSWRKSRWHSEGNPARTIGCRECHMPLVDSTDPASGDLHDFNRNPDDGKHRSHRFLAANQFIPRVMELPGAQEHCDLTVQWLRGEYEVPEIADRWTEGPVIRLDLAAPERVRPGQEVTVRTILTNNKTGHDFPTGPLDMIEAWVELTVTDDNGNIVYESARPDERGYLVNPQIVFKSEPIDRKGDLVGRHELWRKIGSRYNRSLFPGFTDTTSFIFECPGMPTDPERRASIDTDQKRSFSLPAGQQEGQLQVAATLWYTKFSAPFLDRLFGPDSGYRSEATDIARAEAVITVVADALSDPE